MIGFFIVTPKVVFFAYKLETYHVSNRKKEFYLEVFETQVVELILS